jgi:CRP-like cAMP-binding protein
MMPQTVPAFKNLFLSALPESELKRIEPFLERIDMKLGTVVHEPEAAYSYVYFPETAVISIVTCLEDGSNIETGIIGKEGVAGVTVILSDQASPRESTIQVAGSCLRLKADIFKKEFARNEELSRLSLRFVFAFIAQISQNAACVNKHRIEARLARWLLMLDDRVEGKEIRITQEFIAQMLGAHRPSVTECAIKLQEKGLIQYMRGVIKILDRPGLEKATCECYKVVKDSYGKYLVG